MKELDYLPNFWSKVYWDFLHFPKKIWGLWAHPLYGAPDPPNGACGGSGPHRGGGPKDPKFFLGILGSANRHFLKKLGRYTPYIMDFFS